MRAVAVLSLLLVAACHSSPTDADATVVVPFGSSQRVNSEVRVSFKQIVEDSRCPASVVCAWQGNAAIRLDVTTRSGAQTITLNTAGGTSFPREVSAGGYTFTLLQLDPQRQTPDPIPSQQYRATLRIVR